jgi:nucleoside-diphosphate-sugar epimerase
VNSVPGGFEVDEVRRRRYPIIGEGTGIFSLIHIDDAASATLTALDRGAGIYNVCDDEPARQSEWLPAYAEAIGAKRPRRIPLWLAGLIAGQQAARLATRLEGASNEKAKRELGWQPEYPSWREGFRVGLG